jgi:hypothetical protein
MNIANELLQPMVSGTPNLEIPDVPITGALTKRSTPGLPMETQKASEVLSQGIAFQQTIPVVPVPKVITKVVKVKVPNHCPDMTDYIRKDSIPCWACKLG